MNKIEREAQGDLADACSDIRAAMTTYEEIKAEFEAKVAEIVAEANAARDKAYGILDEAASDAESYYDERSEKWQEGDRGSAYSDWKDALRSLADQIEDEIEAPEIAELEEPGWLGELENQEFVEFNP
jgi:hypothetical protein